MKPPLAEEEENSAFRTRAEALIHLGHNWVWDIKTDTIYWSNEMIGIYGIDPLSFDCKGSVLGKMIHPEDAWKRERAIAEVLQGKKVEPFEYRVIRSDRSERVVLVKDMQLDRSPDGRRTYLVGAIQDITERKQLEEQLSLLNLELEKRVRARTAQLEQANLRLKELDRLKSMFIATTSHELRTPLNSIIGFISMTLQGLSGDLNEEQHDNLSRAYGSAMHLLSLVTDIIDISRIEAGKTEVFPESVPLEEVVAEAAGAIEPQAKSKGLSLSMEIPPGAVLFTDRKRLLQCLINLLGNAVKFTERGGIRVVAKEGEESVELSIIDTGIGIAEKDLPRLFQPFERLESPLRVKAGGTGLGLYLTRKLCTDLLRGSISVQSRAGEGSSFTMRIARELRDGCGSEAATGENR
jgi:PAS domain S-box-containing protein